MSDQNPRIRHVVGCMTGTSLDAIDAVLTRIVGSGLEMTAEFVGAVSVDLPDDLRATLLAMANGEPHPSLDYARAARYVGVFHAEAVAELIKAHGHAAEASGGIDFVVPHGQTIWHAPDDAVSWQLFDPWPIVRTLKLPVCYDLRQADLVAGGQGAPITPMADWFLYRDKAGVVLNLGGVANATKLFRKESQPTGWHIRGFDIGPCNLLLDYFCRQLTGMRYDRDGEVAAKGNIEVTERADGTPDGMYFDILSGITPITSEEKSFGREDFTEKMLGDLLQQVRGESPPEDILRSTVEAVAQQCGSVCCMSSGGDIVLAGGGARNKTLVKAITDYVEGYEVYEQETDTYRPYPGKVVLSDDLGIPAEAREAMGFAVLGALSQDGVPITLPAVTGAESPGVAGVWAYPDGPPR